MIIKKYQLFSNGDSNDAIADIMQHQGHTACIHVLGAGRVDNNGNTALHVAASEGHVKCISILLDRGANIKSKNNISWTALHAAASKGHVKCIDALIYRGADIENKNNIGDTAIEQGCPWNREDCLAIANSKNYTNMIEWIERYGKEEETIINELINKLQIH